MTEAIVVMLTAATPAEAVSLARMLIDKHLAACVQILPEMLSVYRWEGAIQQDPEHLLLIKTRREPERVRKIEDVWSATNGRAASTNAVLRVDL